MEDSKLVPQKKYNLKSFQGLRPLAPAMALPWTQAVWTMTLTHARSFRLAR